MAEAESVPFDEARKFLSMRAQAADEFKIGLLEFPQAGGC